MPGVNKLGEEAVLGRVLQMGAITGLDAPSGNKNQR